MTAVDWNACPEPWRSIGPAFRLECERIAGKATRSSGTQSRPALELGGGGIPPVARQDGSDDAGSGRDSEPQPAVRVAKSGPYRRPLSAAKWRRANRQPERPKDVVPAEDAAAIDEFLTRRRATVLPAAYAEATSAAKP